MCALCLALDVGIAADNEVCSEAFIDDVCCPVQCCVTSLVRLHLPACCTQVAEGLNDTAENLLAAIAADEPEVSPSTLYATAAILEGVPFINGSPQNTFVPGRHLLGVFGWEVVVPLLARICSHLLLHVLCICVYCIHCSCIPQASLWLLRTACLHLVHLLPCN